MLETHRQSSEARGRIVAAAAKLFAERGYGSVSMREIAEAAEVSKPMIYYYFDSKVGLCRALVDECVGDALAMVEKVAAQPISVVERLRRLARIRFQKIRQNPYHLKFFLKFLHGPDSAGLAEEYVSRIHSAERKFTDLVAHGQHVGELRPDVAPEVAANVFIGALNAHIFQHVQFGAPPLDDDRADAIVEVFVNGMRPKADAITER